MVTFVVRVFTILLNSDAHASLIPTISAGSSHDNGSVEEET